MFEWLFPKPIDPATRLVIGLLDMGIGWDADHYHLTHRECGVSIWIANQWYGIGYTINGKRAEPSKFPIGKLPKHSQKRLVKAVKRCLSESHADVEKLAARINQYCERHEGANVVPMQKRA